MKPILIKQKQGLGDILFCQKIAQTFSSQGHRIIWPIYSEYKALLPYLNGFNVEYVNETDNFEFKEQYAISPNSCITEHEHCKVVATDGCNMDSNWLISKYKLVGEEWKDWAAYMNFNRNLEKENELFYKKLSINDGEEYALINNFIGTPPICLQKINITPLESNIRKIYVEILPEFTLFDWCKVAENAAELYIEGSALMCVCEKLSLKAENNKKMFLYSRDNFAHVGCIYTKPWHQVTKNIYSS